MKFVDLHINHYLKKDFNGFSRRIFIGRSEGAGGPVAANSGKIVCDFLMQILSDRHLECFDVQNFPKARETIVFYAFVIENMFKASD